MAIILLPIFLDVDSTSQDDETGTPWRIIDRQVSSKTVEDDDDDVRNILCSIRFIFKAVISSKFLKKDCK